MAYVADITDYKSRSTRFGILEVVYVFAVMASFFTGGIWLKNSGKPFIVEIESESIFMTYYDMFTTI